MMLLDNHASLRLAMAVYTIAAASLVFQTHAQSTPLGASCIPSTSSFNMYFQGRCSWTDFTERLQIELERNYPDCTHTAFQEAQLLLGLLTAETTIDECAALQREEEAMKAVNASCQAAFDSQPALAWRDVTQKHLQGEPLFDTTYFNGGGTWNEYYQTEADNRVPYVPEKDAHVLKKDASRVDDIYEAVAKEQKIEYADAVVDNFADCPVRAAMCCWVADRQANDNNGNCATPYDANCVDADPGDNTDICYVDMSRDKDSAHTDGGFTLFPGDNSGGEGPAHCHGLAWSNDPNDTESRYRGNNIFFVSMYDHLYTRGYVRNVPGAPMCGCLDKMPVVSRADCTQVDVTEQWIATFHPANGTEPPSFKLDLDPENGIEVDFNACQGAGGNNDLEKYYKRLRNEGRASEEEYQDFRKTIVGNNQCQTKIDEFVVTQGFEKI